MFASGWLHVIRLHRLRSGPKPDIGCTIFKGWSGTRIADQRALAPSSIAGKNPVQYGIKTSFPDYFASVLSGHLNHYNEGFVTKPELDFGGSPAQYGEHSR